MDSAADQAGTGGGMGDMAPQKATAAAWFAELQDRIAAAFERLEDEQATGPHADLAPGRFERSETRRATEAGDDGGGGTMAVMRGGRVFEKVGVNVSAVHGRLGERAQRSLTSRKDLPGLAEDPRFWASGISLVAHMRSPKVPAVHMNTRFFWTPVGWWFGGGSDLNPMREVAEDTAFFHGVLARACAPHGDDLYPRYKAWADEYFFITHRGEARGVGGIFYDDHCSGDWGADFAFTQDVGRAFLDAYVPVVERRRDEPWTDEDRAHQLFRRGRYAEFNLVYDRGTRFGLETGHNIDAVLMSMPPQASWP
ncbi:MAG: oxygen-dependent coproporphyrinogen oxidase [Pseudomonadota bacterium]